LRLQVREFGARLPGLMLGVRQPRTAIGMRGLGGAQLLGVRGVSGAQLLGLCGRAVGVPLHLGLPCVALRLVRVELNLVRALVVVEGLVQRRVATL